MQFVWKDHYNRYLQMQRNHKKFSSEMLEDLVNLQKEEIAKIDTFLMKAPRNVLDIGCGLGIYDLSLHDFYKGDINFYLLDKTTSQQEDKKIYYGYREQGAFYNNMDYTKEFLTLNGIPEDKVNIINVVEDLDETKKYLSTNLPKIDLVISIISWGFHYPVSTYLDTVYDILSDDGTLCFHCRKLETNLPILKSKFSIVWPPEEKIKSGSLLICKKKN